MRIMVNIGIQRRSFPHGCVTKGNESNIALAAIPNPMQGIDTITKLNILMKSFYSYSHLFED